MVDIDHFKLFNDRCGHLAGDQCLQRIATELARDARATDLIVRYGGEEFADVMPNTDISAAIPAAERLRVAIMDLAVWPPASKDHIVTISVGVSAAVPAAGRNTQELVEAADAQLYRAKRVGRNCVRGASIT